MFDNSKKQFREICTHNGLNLDYELNRKNLFLMRSIFCDREYADFFPFYEDAVILDIGAHYGYFSLFASVNAGRNARVISVEPDQNNYLALKNNMDSCSIKNVEAHKLAIGEKAGDGKLFHGSSINSTLVQDYALNKNKDDFEMVQVKTFDNFWKDTGLSHVDFLKLDCEGAEYDIILQNSSVIFDKVTTISMEFHDLKQAGKTGNALVSKLSGLGFRIVKFQYDPTTMGLNYGKLIATKLF